MRRTRMTKVVALAIAGLVLTACSAGDTASEETEGDNGDPASTEETDEIDAGDEGEANAELSLWLFGDFGYDELIEQYETDHPGITIETRIAEYNAHHDAITTALAAGSGGADIVAIEVGAMAQFLGQAEGFANLLDFGAGDLEGTYLDWKWEQALTPDGSRLIGLPTDVGGLAMAYRTDLFEEAGLPTDRAEVSALWPTWDDFLQVGRDYVETTGRAFTDESSQLFAAVLNQADEKFYTDDGALVHETSAGVSEAWRVATAASTDGITLNVEPFAEGWNAAMSNGDFATLTAPAWMMGYIQGQAPDTEGLWDIADVPGDGGNWGGSHLAIPASSEHQQEAYDFIEWLLSPENQLAVFENTGNFPSVPALYEDPAITEFTNPFFNDAPVGEIYSTSAAELAPSYEGPEHATIRLIFENALDRIDDGAEDPEAAWQSALAEVSRDIG